ncbi:MAG: hypothetical protein EA361_06465 [Bacteroidetes bacterium]|nr:MAG: hypothetical protein EA361_06465 [Bacteroidota bacterium]
MDSFTKFSSYSLVFFLLFLFTHTAMGSEREAVTKTVQTAYVEGFQNLGGKEMMEAGFHPTFIMVLNRGGVLSELPLQRMIEIAEQRKNNPDYTHVEVEARILDVDVTGNAAMVKLELYREGRLLFTDYLGLYKFDDGWKIFNKLYHQH